MTVDEERVKMVESLQENPLLSPSMPAEHNSKLPAGIGGQTTGLLVYRVATLDHTCTDCIA